MLMASVVPLAAVLGAMVLAWNHIFGWSDLVVTLVMYVISGFGISTGYHRMLTHRAFETYKPIRYSLATAGCWPGRVRPSSGRRTTASTTGSPTSPVTRTARTWTSSRASGA
ncbi:hypothetical protein NKH77_53995 [Streptomyces sp. M19]